MANKQQMTDRDKKTSTKQCPTCGMPRSEWANPAGFKKDDKTYCCEGCAQKSGCTCE